jgi:TP901 family phage tail tape measure protein
MEVASLNKQLQSQAFTNSARTQATQFAETRKQANLMQKTWADATASTGLFDVSSRKIRSHTDEWVKNVQRQRMSLRDLMSDMNGYKAARNEQMRMQQMSIASFASDKNGNPLASIAIPRTAIRDTMSLRNELGFAAHAAESIGTQMINSGKNMQWAGRQLTMGFTAPLMAAGALSAKFALEVDKELTSVAKVYDTYATTQAGQEKELVQLRQNSLSLAKQTAQEYGMAAKDTISIMSQLASAGQRGDSLQKNTKETARFATLGDFDSDSAVNATRTLKAVFGIQNDELAKSVDFMNNIENSTSLTMSDMAEAIPTASAAVKNLNGSYKDMLVLLTAMKERGFDPGESANALKAAGTRLIRPSKRVQEEFQGLTGESITDIRDRNQGDLIKTLLDVGKATQNLGTAQKQQARAALFGTEQAARLGGAMDGLIAAQDGVGETAKAMEVAQMSAADNAAIAAKEMSRQQDSLSGKWKRAVETIKVQSQAMGEAFIKAGTVILTTVSGLIDMFGGLPDVAKKGLVWTALLTAVAGPLLMLIGLSKNLGGQVIRTAAMVVRGLTGFKLMTVEQTVAAKAAELTSARLKQEGTAVEGLTLQLSALSNAFKSAATAQGLIRPGPLGAPPTSMQNIVAPATRQNYVRTVGGVPQTLGPQNSTNPTILARSQSYGEGGVNNQAALRTAQAEAAATRQARTRAAINKASGALMVASMATTMTTSNSVAGNIAKWGMLAALVGPALTPMLGAIKKAKSGMGAMGVLSRAAFSPWTLGAAAVGAGIYMWYKHMKKVRQELDDVYNDSDKLAKILGADPNKKAGPGAGIGVELSEAQKEQVRLNKESEKADKLAERLQKAYPKVVENIKEANDPQQKYNEALRQGLKVITDMGLKGEDANKVIRGFLDAADKASTDPIMLSYGIDLNDSKEVTRALKEQNAAMVADLNTSLEGMKENFKITKGEGVAPELTDEDKSKLKAIGKNMGTILYSNLATEGKKGVGVFNEQEKEWTKLQDAMGDNEDLRESAIRGMLKGYNVTGKAADDAIAKLKDQGNGLRENISLYDALGAASVQRNVAVTAKRELGVDSYSTKKQGKMQALYNETFIKTDGTNIQKQAAAVAAVRSEVEKANNGSLKFRNIWGETNATLTNGVSVMNALGVSTANSASMMSKLRSAAAGIQTGAIGDANTALQTGTSDSMAAGHTAALEGIERAGEASSEAFDKKSQALSDRQAARSQALEDRQKKRSDMLEKAQAKVQKRFEDRWNKKKKILEDEEALRQKTFEAEKTRIERMKELNNDKVDLKVAIDTGQLDQAAKIQGEMGAKQATWALEDNMSAGSEKAEAAKAALDEQEAKEKDRLDTTLKAQQDALEKRNQAEQRALEKRNQTEQRGLEAQKAAAAKSVQIATDAENKKYAVQKKAVDDGIAWIISKNPQTQAQLDDLVTKAQARFGIMGDYLRNNADTWGKNMVDSMAKRTLEAYKEITGADYAKSGEQISSDFMKGMSGGKITTAQLITYMQTGKLPKTGAEAPAGAAAGGAAGAPKKGGKPRSKDDGGTGRHTGGPVGPVNITDGSRSGYPANAEKYPSEKWILAKNDEYVIDGKTHRKVGTTALDELTGQKGSLGSSVFSHARHTGGPVTKTAGLVGAPQAAMGRTVAWSLITGALDEANKNMKAEIAAKEAAKAAAAAAKAGPGAAGAGGGGTAGGAPKGPVDPNGWNSPWKGHYGTRNGHDWGVPYGTAIYAPHSGSASGYDIPGYEPRVPHGGHGYRSYGRVMQVTGGGANIMFAHMSTRAFDGPKKVSAGDYLGKSGEMGNAHGAHVHMELNHRGDNSGVGGFFGARGVKLLKGGTVRYDNTPAVLHADERVLKATNTQKLDEGIDRIATGDVGGYTVEQQHIHINGEGWTPKDIPALAKEIKKEFDKEDSRHTRRPKP